MKYLIFISSLVLFSCTKDSAPIAPAEPSARYKALTSHYWQVKKIWFDSTDFGVQNPTLIPISTSTNVYIVSDSCNYYTCRQFNPDGFMYNIKGKWCGYPNNHLLIVKDFPWSLSNNEQTLTNYGYETIITLNDSILKYYDIGLYNFTRLGIKVYELKPFEYK